jgi:hypothetical protein
MRTAGSRFLRRGGRAGEGKSETIFGHVYFKNWSVQMSFLKTIYRCDCLECFGHKFNGSLGKQSPKF